MHFTALLASTMLIVLISVYSTSALPMNQTEIEEEMTTVVASTKRVSPKKKLVSKEEVCPEGTKANKNGLCKPIEPSSDDENQATDACPENYIRVDASCLFIKSKQSNSTKTNETMLDSSKLIKPRLGNVATSAVENFPTLPDNSCPEGTEYSEHGVCQKIVSPVDMKPQKSKPCPENSQLVQGKCLPLKPKIVMTTMRPSMPITEKIDLTPEFESTPAMNIEATTIVEETMEAKTQKSKQCPENSQLVQGKCLPLKPKIVVTTMKSSMPITEKIDLTPEFESTPAMNIEATTIVEETMEAKTQKSKQCPENSQLVQGKCLPLKPKIVVTTMKSSMPITEKIDLTPEFSSTPAMNIEATTIVEETMETKPQKSKQCPENSQLVQGKCLPLKPKIVVKESSMPIAEKIDLTPEFSSTPAMNIEATTIIGKTMETTVQSVTEQ